MKQFYFTFVFSLFSIFVYSQNFYLAPNGVTCMCPDAAIGETGVVNGVTYTKRTKEQITPANAATTCTSGITDMSGLFSNNSFNSDISSWDTSNVTDMSMMFQGTSFNQPLNNWDVSNVLNMVNMFSGTSDFNQPLNDWDVSSVMDMGWMFNNTTSFNQSLNDWDVSSVTNMREMFRNATSFNQSINDWDVSSVTNMEWMFKGAFSFNQPINDWDVSNVTTMALMFDFASSFNQPLNDWDVSNVIYMHHMFNKADSFNQPLNNWNVSSVNNMNSMFYGATSFNQSLNNWDVSSVTDMYRMFFGANSFNLSLNNWNTSNVTDMRYMFFRATSFNQPINNWDVSSVTTLQRMFDEATSFNQPLSNWNTSNVTDMYGMFYNATSFNQPLNTWDVSNVTDMGFMFTNATSFNQSLNDWDVSSVTTMSQMFSISPAFNGNISSWNVSSVTDMGGMFYEATSFNQPLNGWDVSNVNNMNNMFNGAISFNQPLVDWNVSSVTTMSRMFNNAVYFNQDLSSWDFNVNVSFDTLWQENGFINNSGLDATNYTALLERFVTLGLQNKSLYARGMFYCDTSVRNTLINSLNWNITGDKFLVDCNPIISPDAFVSIWDASGLPHTITIPTSGSGYNYNVDFGDGTVLTNLTGSTTHTYSQPGSYYVSITGDFPRIYFNDTGDKSKILEVVKWGNIQWQSMENAFSGCNNLRIYATDTPDLNQVANMSRMFEKNSFLNQNFNNWNVSNVTNMSKLFSMATIYNMPLNNWDVSSVTNMSGMFDAATLFNQPLSTWDVSNVINMERMFAGTNSFNHSFDNWNVSNVTNMNGMFIATYSFNQPLSNWDVSNVTDMGFMFSLATSFNQPLNDWDVSSVTYMRSMFREANSFNQPLDNWDVSNVTDIGYMFNEATIFNQPINNWDVSNVTIIAGTFKDASSFNQPLNDWDVSSVTSMNFVFEEALAFNQPLFNWDVSNVINMSNIFHNATNFNQNISNWNFNQSVIFHTTIPTERRFLSGTAMDIQNYDALLARFIDLGLQDKRFGADGLYYCNEGARNYLIDTLGWEIVGDNQSDGCNSIVGSIRYDQNNNGCDINDINVDGIMINANNGQYDFSTFSSNGMYNLSIYGTSFTVALANVPNYFTVSPETATITFSGSNTEELNFCLTANQTVNDLNITFLAIEEARPGFETEYQLVVRNVGTETINTVSATLHFDNVMQSFVSALPSPTSTTGSSLSFELGTIQPFETRYMDITMQTFPPPTVNGGDILQFTATVTPDAGDFTPDDNTYEMEQVVVNSFDPNDKQVMQGAEVHIDDVDQYLDYLIRFQNTGTASAINVRILDTLHPKLDWNTLIPISASHDYFVQISNGNHVEFMFNNIHLPDSLSNEPESHGYVAYKIKPKSNVQVGDVISGDAAIYFDFNAPIITNMVHTTIVEPLSVTDMPNPLNQVVLYPNPTNKTLNIHLTDGIELEQVIIYDLQGKEVHKIQDKSTILDVESLRPGMYFLKITTNRGVVNRKLVKN